MKKVIFAIISIISFIILISDFEKLTFSLVLIKIMSLVWLYIIVNANNYFYQGEE